MLVAGRGGGDALTADHPLLNAPNQTQREYEAVNGPLDVRPPVVDVASPAPGSKVLIGQDVRVVLQATDDVAIAPGTVRVMFDIDGSGAIDQTGETLFPTPTGKPGEFHVTFTRIAGPDGIRKIDARATDKSSNVGQDLVPIVIPEPDATLMLLAAMGLLAILRRWRRRHAPTTPTSARA